MKFCHDILNKIMQFTLIYELKYISINLCKRKIIHQIYVHELNTLNNYFSLN